MIIFCFWSTILWFEMKLTHKWHLYNHFWPFSCHLYVHLSKNRGWVVTLRCLTSLNLNWYKSYDTKHKNEKKTQMSVFVQNHTKPKWKYLYFASYILNQSEFRLVMCSYVHQNDLLNLSFLKDTKKDGKIWPEMVVKVSFRIRVYFNIGRERWSMTSNVLLLESQNPNVDYFLSDLHYPFLYP